MIPVNSNKSNPETMQKNFILVITLAVLLFPVMSAPADWAGTITGRMLMKDGTPISGGIVFFLICN